MRITSLSYFIAAAASVAATSTVTETQTSLGVAKEAAVDVDSVRVGGRGGDVYYEKDGLGPGPRRILLSNNEKISDIINHGESGEFEIEAKIINEDDNKNEETTKNNNDTGDTINISLKNSSVRTINNNSEQPSSIFLHVTQVQTPITPQTTFHFREGRTFDKTNIVGNTAMLASTPAERESGVTTLLSVNLLNGEVKGVQRENNGDVRKISLVDEDGSGAGSAGLELRKRSISVGAMREFTCGVAHKGEKDENLAHDHNGLFERNRHLWEEEEHFHHRHEVGGHDDHHHANHGHSVHDYEHDSILTVKNGQGYRMLTSNASQTNTNNNSPSFSFQINLVIDIDAELINKQGGTEQTIEYVNFIVGTANIIFENELNAHLNVLRVQETTVLDQASSLRDGLRVMRTHYAGIQGIDGLSDKSINLRHALLGRNLGGGIAFIDTVCDSNWGVGLSSGLMGKISNLDEDAMYDAFMFAHEVGHSLGSDHTFEYDTPIDTCEMNSCPGALPLDNSATIMSYCNFCSGGLSNIAMTLGGVWNQVGSKQELSSWVKAPEIVGMLSNRPYRVAHRIWRTLDSKGECIIPPPPTPAPTHVPTSAPTSAKPTNAPTPKPSVPPTTKPSSAPTAPPTHAPTLPPSTPPQQLLTNTTSKPISGGSSPFTNSPTAPPTPTPTTKPVPNATGVGLIASPTIPQPVTWANASLEADTLCSTNCVVSQGVMFDVGLKAGSAKDTIHVTSISFEHTKPLTSGAKVELYTAFMGTYVGSEHTPYEWVKIATATVPDVDFEFEKINLSYPIPIVKGEKRGFYLVVDTESLLVIGSGGGIYLSDDLGAELVSGSAIVDKFGESLDGYSWAGKIGYKYEDK